MTDQTTSVEHTAKPESPTRRATIATGSAAVLAWSAPLVVSSEAHAAGYCTPKCYPAQTWTSTITYTLFRYCLNPDGSPTSGQGKNLFVYIDKDAAALAKICPCTSGTMTPTAPTSIAVYGTNFRIGNKDLTVTNKTVTVDGVPRQGFVLSTNGAIPAGTLTGCVRVVVTCKDRDGDTLYSWCDITVAFTSDPGGGACGTKQTTQTGTPVVVSCGKTCNVAPSTTPSC